MADPRNTPSQNPQGEQTQGGPPGWRPHERGWREGDPRTDSIMPGKDAGAGRQIDDGPRRAWRRRQAELTNSQP